jgi:hypothetical protein
MRHRPFDRDPTPLPRQQHRPRPQVKFAAGRLSQSWPWDEKLEGSGHSNSSPITIVIPSKSVMVAKSIAR